jgi:carbon-monoxide dehydrogenase small subunit
MLGAMADGREITTVEGLATDGVFNHVQQGMWDAMAFQCAFCSPGFIMSTMALLEENPNPTKDEIREELSGNLCRCTGYASIIDGVMAAIDNLGDAQ